VADKKTVTEAGTSQDMFEKKEINVKSIALERALAMLRAASCQYVVLTEDGTQFTHGDLEVVKATKRKHLKRNAPYGAMNKHYLPILEELQVGEMALVPYGDFPRKPLHSAVSAWCSKHFGNRNTITHYNDQGIEVLRVM
jgi:hypothetical protein